MSPESDCNDPLKHRKNKDAKEIPYYVHVRKFTEKWEDEHFWPQFWANYGDKRAQNAAAVQVQRIVRGLLGKVEARRRLDAALDEVNQFWDMNNNLKMLAKEKKRIEKETRQRVSVTAVDTLFMLQLCCCC